MTSDPTAAARRARYKQRHGGICLDCGARTSLNKIGDQAERCVECHLEHVAAQHGTRSCYTAGCRCDECRRANTEAHRVDYRRRAAAAVTATRPITPPQLAVLSILRNYQADKGYPPTIRELMRAGGWKSPSTVYVHLRALRRAGLVDWVDGAVRTLHVVEPSLDDQFANVRAVQDAFRRHFGPEEAA